MDIWGPDHLEFRPERFDTLTELQAKAYYPYSMKPHRCPAYAGFGDRMITMLVVAMGRNLAPELGRIRYNDHVLDKDMNAPLPTGRDQMEKWVYEFGTK